MMKETDLSRIARSVVNEHADRLKKYRLSGHEYDQICTLLKRPPQGVEWALFSALWSEHCSYKSSRLHLKKLFRDSPRVVQSFGENAGIVDLGEGERVAFKMESHNHPSFIEPYQGAATGVGGILRDIFTMGARPIMSANYLCFGESESPLTHRLIDGVVRGIGGYGNCVGVPTVSGQTEFHSSYQKNNLVNALSVGYFGAKDPVALSGVKGPGNLVVYVGAKTGRDGIHGASMASESFAEKGGESKRPTIQIGDPFYEKLLIEACLEVIKKGLVVSIQDMGAAGLTSSSFEMSAKGKLGLDLHLDKIPLRDSTMEPEDILLSESQERMLLISTPENFPKLKSVFDVWGLEASEVGVVRTEPTVRLFWKGEILTEMDPKLLTDHAPEYNRAFEPWISKLQAKSPLFFQNEKAEPKVLFDILRSAQGTSRSWIYRQYDQRVGTMTVRDCQSSVAVQRLPETGRGLGLVLGCRPQVMRLDAALGGMDSVLYPYLELSLKGFEPLAMTDCLNFGNPERLHIMSEFVGALEGMNAACKEAGVPIISGNVSFYNETESVNITSTPSTGLVGLRANIENIPHDEFTKDGDQIWLISAPGVSQTGTFAEHCKKPIHGTGAIDTKRVVELGRKLQALPQDKVVASRMVGKFGLLYALSRMTMGGVGAKIAMTDLQSPMDRWFTENMYEVLIVTPHGFDLGAHLKNFECHLIGSTGGKSLVWGAEKWSVEEMQNAYFSGGLFEKLA
ncbi:MAG: phosphoribosylformylglycinamidine synthase subunit PurL [Bdellovibrionales bacterium]|nr:phosphoribosylformylglycinamidine synthase subunit PurL [Bdellovibrionales bacterium]